MDCTVVQTKSISLFVTIAHSSRKPVESINHFEIFVESAEENGYAHMNITLKKLSRELLGVPHRKTKTSAWGR